MAWTEHPCLSGLDAEWLHWLQWAGAEDLRKNDQLMEVFALWLRDAENPAHDRTLHDLVTRLPVFKKLYDAVNSLRMDTLDGPRRGETADAPAFELAMQAKGDTILGALLQHPDVKRIDELLGLGNRFTAAVPGNVFAISASNHLHVDDDVSLEEALEQKTGRDHLNFYAWMQGAEEEAKRLYQEALNIDLQLEQQALADETKVRAFFDDCLGLVARRLGGQSASGSSAAAAARVHGDAGREGGRAEDKMVKFAFDIDGELVTDTKPREAGMSALYSLGLPEIPASTFYSARRKPGQAFNVPGLAGFSIVFDAISRDGGGKQLMWTIYGTLSSLSAGFTAALNSLPVDTRYTYTQYRDKVVLGDHADLDTRIHFAVVRYAAMKASGGTGTGELIKRMHRDAITRKRSIILSVTPLDGDQEREPFRQAAAAADPPMKVRWKR